MSFTYQDEFFGPEGVGDVIESSDYICLTAALTPETRHMVGAAELARAKRSAGKEIQSAALGILILVYVSLYPKPKDSCTVGFEPETSYFSNHKPGKGESD